MLFLKLNMTILMHLWYVSSNKNDFRYILALVKCNLQRGKLKK